MKLIPQKPEWSGYQCMV